MNIIDQSHPCKDVAITLKRKSLEAVFMIISARCMDQSAESKWILLFAPC